ncbi:hypothetical protein D3C86_1745080 [compost metagenome]
MAIFTVSALAAAPKVASMAASEMVVMRDERRDSVIRSSSIYVWVNRAETV